MEKNLTSGSVLKNIAGFSLPYLLSYFLQTLYGMADLFIIGQFSGTADITAVSIGSQVMHMLTVMIVGLAMGATIAIGRAVGGREQERAALAVGNSVTLFMGVSVVLTVISLGSRGALAYALCPDWLLGVSGIWWAVPIGWFLADAVGLAYYWRKRKGLFVRTAG